MKTSVSELMFDKLDYETGRRPSIYEIRVTKPYGGHYGDLKSRYVINLLEKYGDIAINFPKKLMEEVYDDCCFAYFTRTITMGDSEKIFSVRKNYVDAGVLGDIMAQIRQRGKSRVGTHSFLVDKCTESGLCRKLECSLRDKCEPITEDYDREDDWILDLISQSELVKMTYILLNLRRDLWRASPKSLRGSKEAITKYCLKNA